MSAAAAASVDVEIEGRQLKLSNLDKVLYPEAGFTKGQVIDYYSRIAPVLLPHLRRRPLTLKRYPNGVDAQFFYEKNCPKHRPDWVETIAVWSARNKADVNYCLCNELASLVWVANLASLELHTSLSWAPEIQQPSMVVFDLDPGPPATIVECGRVAMWLREVLDDMGLASFAKTSGSKGLQVYVPLNVETSYAHTKPLARRIAELLEQRMPQLVVSRMTKRLRPGRVLVDWSQNDEHKTTVTVYSARARERPTVSTPVTWDEVARCLEERDARTLTFEVADVLARAEELGDLFAPAVSLRQEPPAASG